MKTFNKEFRLIFIPFLGVIVIIFFFPFFLTRHAWLGLDFTKSGQIGDTIGGIMGPFIAIAAAILTFFAFWVQYKANEQQKKDLQIERFENRFFHLIELHRLNVSEITIGKSINNKRSFIVMFNELKFLYLATKKFIESKSQQAIINHITNNGILVPEDIFNIAYLTFFYGIGQNSTRLILSLTNHNLNDLILNYEEYLKALQIEWKKDKTLNIEEITHRGDDIFEFKSPYIPFNGHMSRLGHYMRNMFHLVRYINDQDDSVFDYDHKFNYASTLRAQLSEHEQIILYYHALSTIGKSWNAEKYEFIQKYCLIKNIPIPLADFYIAPNKKYNPVNKMGKKMFLENYE